jgi:hypothetical protein
MNNILMWAIGIAVTIALAINGYNLSRSDAVARDLAATQLEMNRTFLQKDIYYKEQGELSLSIRALTNAIEDLDKKSETRSKETQTIIRDHERNTTNLFRKEIKER